MGGAEIKRLVEIKTGNSDENKIAAAARADVNRHRVATGNCLSLIKE